MTAATITCSTTNAIFTWIATATSFPRGTSSAVSAQASGLELEAEEESSSLHCLNVLCDNAQATQPLCFSHVSSGSSWAVEERQEWG